MNSGHSKSCGCMKHGRIGEFSKTANRNGINNGSYKHGLCGTRLYVIWANMKQRCFNPKATEYSAYGGRGITVCDEWKNDAKKFADWSVTHGYASNLTLDRIDVNGNYEPDNCRWIPQSEQYTNMRKK